MMKLRDVLKAQPFEQPSATLSPNLLPGTSDSFRSIPPKARTLDEELVEATPPSIALEVFGWQAILVRSTVLEMSVWVVRDSLHGLALAKETGHPALMLDDVLKQRGLPAEEARAAVLPLLIAVPQ